MRGRVGGRRLRHADQPVVPDNLARLLPLLDLEDADEAHVDEAPHGTRCVHQDQNIERIAIAARSVRQEAEVEWEGHPDRQDVAQPECGSFGVVLQLVVAALRRLNDDLDDPGVRVGCRHDRFGID